MAEATVNRFLSQLLKAGVCIAIREIDEACACRRAVLLGVLPGWRSDPACAVLALVIIAVAQHHAAGQPEVGGRKSIRDMS